MNYDREKIITDSNEYETKSVIIATGSKYRLLGLENEQWFLDWQDELNKISVR